MADDITKPETQAKTAGRKPAVPAAKAATKKPATAKKATATAPKKPATVAKKPATAAKRTAKAKPTAPKKANGRWPAIAGGAVAAVAAAGAAVFALRKPKAIEALAEKVEDAVGVSGRAEADAGKTGTNAAVSSNA